MDHKLKRRTGPNLVSLRAIGPSQGRAARTPSQPHRLDSGSYP